MKRKRHSPEQILGKLREAEAGLSVGQSIGQVCQKLAISGGSSDERVSRQVRAM
ncbi:MAG: hypothetical protein SF069_11675 [Phycisphaerae bacterium]|nr:hypothetical protein [Phycisphaerae bacterium]